MQYARVITPVRKALIALKPTNWGKPYQKLFNQTNVSGREAWLAYSSNNFNNPFQQADEARYEKRGWWAELFRDAVREGGKGEVNGRLDIVYVSHAGTKWERIHSGILAPKDGWYVPTDDDLFYEGTLIPFETLPDRNEAIERLEAKGIPAEQVSYFWRSDRYDSERFVGRIFGPHSAGGGRFSVDADRHPSISGYDGVASRPAYKPEIVMEVAEKQEVAAR